MVHVGDHFDDLTVACDERIVVLSVMRIGAVHAAFQSAFGAGEIAAALLAQHVQRAVAEQAVKVFFGNALMAGEVFALAVLEKRVVARGDLAHVLHL